MNNKNNILLRLVFTSTLVLYYPLNASHTRVISEEGGDRAENSMYPVQVSLSCRPKSTDDSEHKTKHLIPAVEERVHNAGKEIDIIASEERKVTLVENYDDYPSISTHKAFRSEQRMLQSTVVDFEAAAKKTLSYFYEKLEISTILSHEIRYSVQLANFLMNEESFQKQKENKGSGPLIDNIVDIFKELKEKSEDDAEIKAYWPRVIAAIAMNKRAHTPFFLPNIMTLITRPFPVDFINFIDQELESTKSYRVNAILSWMRRHRFVESDGEYDTAHSRWDISIASRKIRVVDGVWVYESYVSEGKTDNPQWRLSQTEISSYPYNMWRRIDSNARVVVNKHFPEETAELFVKRDTNITTVSSDILKDLVIARYLNWIYKANWNGKNISSFYHPAVKEQNGQMTVLDDMHPHARIDNTWGEFPGMYAYEQMRMSGFRLPSAIVRHLAQNEAVDPDLALTQDFLISQVNRYYTDAAAEGLVVASNYIRKRYLSFYCEHVLPIDLKNMTTKRAYDLLYYFQFGRDIRVKKEHYDELYRISGFVNEYITPKEEKKLMVPPSPRKTPQSSRKEKVGVSSSLIMAQQIRNIRANEVL